MGRSVNDYYADKMKKLLADKKLSDETPRIVAPNGKRTAKAAGTDERVKNPDRQYYDSFRESAQKTKKKIEEQSERVREETKKEEFQQRTVPDQNDNDLRREEEKKEEALETARKAKQRRKIRDGIISGLLISIVVITAAVIIYRLFFIVKNVTVEGELSYYSPEEIVNAANVRDLHLFSFRESTTGKTVKQSCPLIESVDVVRRIPNSIVLKVTEQKPRFWCDFYGETYSLTETLRVAERASDTSGMAKLRLPPVKKALLGSEPEFKNMTNDKYIFEVTEAIMGSEISSRVTMLDLTEKFNIKAAVDNRFLLIFGSTDSILVKTKLAVAGLADEMFKEGNNKYKIDLTDLSATSVVVDNSLELEN